MEFWFEPSQKELNIIFSHLENASSIITKKRGCYILGHGKQPVTTYEELEKQGFNVIWKGIKGPFWVKFISSIVASYYGLIKIKKIEDVKILFPKLSHLSAVSFYSFDKAFENKFTEEIIQSSWRVDCGQIIKKDPSHFIFTLDGDNLETESGMLAIISLGSDCSTELKSLMDNYGEIGYLGETRTF